MKTVLGLRHMEYMCAISNIEGSWPMSISSLFMKTHRIDIGIQTRIRENVNVIIKILQSPIGLSA